MISFINNEVFKELGVVAIVVAGVVWLAKNIFKQIMSKELESFKSNLEKESVQFKIRYEKIQGERLLVIKEFYYKLVEMEVEIHSLVSLFQPVGSQPLEEKKKAAINKFSRCTKYFKKNKIFFNKELSEKIDKLLKLHKNILKDMDLSLWYKNNGVQEDHLKKWMSAYDKVNKKLPGIKTLIENEFRKLLGIENE